jgi:hypothetical protein
MQYFSQDNPGRGMTFMYFVTGSKGVKKNASYKKCMLKRNAG